MIRFSMKRDNPPQSFMGVPKEYSSYAKSKVVVLPLSYEGTASYGLGTKNAPAAIIDASRYLEWYDIEAGKESFHDCGIHTLKELKAESSTDPEIFTKQVFEKGNQLIEDNKLICGLGGEHSVSLGLMQACSKKYKDLSILQIDAHTDLRNEYEGTPYSHASVMRRASEFAKTVHVGIRSICQEEADFIKQNKVSVYYAKDMQENEKWMDKAINDLTDNVYLTLDVDGLDPAVIPNTGTPEPGGLFWWQLLKFLKKLTEAKKIVSFDLVELSPKPGFQASDIACAKLCYKIISYIYA